MSLMLLGDAEFAFKEIPVKAYNYVLKRTGTLVNRGPSRRRLVQSLRDNIATKIMDSKIVQKPIGMAQDMIEMISQLSDKGGENLDSLRVLQRALIPRKVKNVPGLKQDQVEDLNKALQHLQLKNAVSYGENTKEWMMVGRMTDRGIDWTQPIPGTKFTVSPDLARRRGIDDFDSKNIGRDLILNSKNAITIHTHPGHAAFSGQDFLALKARHNFVLTATGGVYRFSPNPKQNLAQSFQSNLLTQAFNAEAKMLQTMNRSEMRRSGNAALIQLSKKTFDQMSPEELFVQRHIEYLASAKMIGADLDYTLSPYERKLLKNLPDLEPIADRLAVRFKDYTNKKTRKALFKPKAKTKTPSFEEWAKSSDKF